MRKQTRRKHWALVNPIQHAIEGAAITPDEKLSQLKLRELAAIEAFAKGKATVREWHHLQRTSISRGEYERFIGELTNRIKSKAPEVVVI